MKGPISFSGIVVFLFLLALVIDHCHARRVVYWPTPPSSLPPPLSSPPLVAPTPPSSSLPSPSAPPVAPAPPSSLPLLPPTALPPFSPPLIAPTPTSSHPPVPPPPPPAPHKPPPPATTFNVLHFGAVGDGSTDDTQAFKDAWSAACAITAASTVVVPANNEFLVGPVIFDGHSCQPNIVFQIDGEMVAFTCSEEWHSGHGAHWLEFKDVNGLTIRGSGTIDGLGSYWWGDIDEIEDRETGTIDGQDSSRWGSFDDDHDNDDDNNDSEVDTESVSTKHRPTTLKLNGCWDVTVTGITIKNSPKFHLTFDTCHGVEAHGITVSSPGRSPNTDGIHLHNSVGVSIHHSTIACGDDCISIQDGTSNVFIHDVNCGPGHGISIGGLGKHDSRAVVSDITVRDVDISQTMTGVRIKTWQGGSGSVKNVTFAGIRVAEVKAAIVIDQFYCDHTTCENRTAAVALSDITYRGVAGTYTTWPVYVACSDSTPCSDVHLDDIQLSPVKEKYHLKGPFCWNADVDFAPPVQPPVNCVMAGST